MKSLRLLAITAISGLGVLASAQGDQSKPMRVRISTGVAEKLKIHDQQPRYPEEALRKGIEGDVILLATIDSSTETGRE
jgi:outer membrane biosynthesis protein TonB